MTQPQSDRPSGSSSTKTIGLLVLAIAIWGIYLGIGATGIWVDRSLFNPVKFAIVVSCSAVFLAGWMLVLAWRQHAVARRFDSSISLAGVASVAVLLVSFALWAACRASLQAAAPELLSIVLGYSAAGGIGLAGVLALIAASDPKPRRGKLVSLLTLAGVVLAFLAWAFQW